MISYCSHTISDYLDLLAAKEPVPGGGSAAALSAAMAAALISMVTRYSLGKGKPVDIELRLSDCLSCAEAARAEFLDLVSRDSENYLKMREAKKGDPALYPAAVQAATAVAARVCALCRELMPLAEFLRTEASRYLLSDVVAAEALLRAGHDAARAMIGDKP